MRFSDTFLDEIRDRVPISAVIGARVTWDRRKTNASRGDFWACCPFHGEKSPSFHCEDKKGRYHCFGCGVSGDHFRFLTELDGISFPEAVEKIADMAGVPMPARDPESDRREQQRASLTDVMEMATKFFEQQLQSPAGARARAYLRDRGLTSATQQSFRLGFAPDSRNALKEFLASKGVEKAQMEACGLVRHGDDIPVSYDYFRDRIMFPIADARGRIVAFGGRALAPDAMAKYMNSPETELFHKGDMLYNFARARAASQKEGVVVAVEGYMDVIALAQAGFENVVAPLGTALTENQLQLLWRASHNPILCFDGDAAGQRAANRAADVAFKLLTLGKTVRFATLPEGQDPDDMVKSGDSREFGQLLQNATPLHEFFISRRRLTMPTDSPEERAAFERQLYADIEPITDQILRKYYRSHLRVRLTEFFSGRARDVSSSEAKKLKIEIHGNKLVATILGMLVEYPMLIGDYIETLMLHDIDSPAYKVFASEIYKIFVEYDDLSISDIYDKLDKKFFAVLNAVHGDQKEVPIRDRYGNITATMVLKRGYRIRQLFPKIVYDPPVEIVRQTLNFLFLKAQFIRSEAEYLDGVHQFSPSEFDHRQHDLIILRDQLLKDEQELADAYDIWGGRRAHATYF